MKKNNKSLRSKTFYIFEPDCKKLSFLDSDHDTIPLYSSLKNVHKNIQEIACRMDDDGFSFWKSFDGVIYKLVPIKKVKFIKNNKVKAIYN